jgi:hypothetical protein
MNEKQEFELLKDIARLLTKYGPDTFDALSKLLDKQEFVDQLVEILNTTADVGRRSKPRSRPKPGGASARTGLDQLLRKLAESEPEKSQFLSAFRDNLLAKNILPSMRAVKAFVSDNGLGSLSATSRDKAIFPLIKELSRHPLEQVKVIVERESVQSQGGDRTLEGWANIILKKSHSNDDV